MHRLLFVASVVLPLIAIAAPQDCRESHTQWMEARMAEAARIKPGMTRAQVLKVMTMDGGLQSYGIAAPQRYLLLSCPLIKLDITFDASNASSVEQRLLDPEARVKSVSKPYLEYPVMD